VLFLIRSLIEFHLTAINWTDERLLSSVNSEMIKEIVPFTKKPSTFLKVAGENLGNPLANI